MKRAALYARVSTDRQDSENQVAALTKWAEARGFEIVSIYAGTESAWSGKKRGLLDDVFRDARAREFDVLLVWALDRLTRQGIAAMFELLAKLDKLGVQVLSHEEKWTEVGGEMLDLLVAISSWIAQQESNRRSARTKLGLERARANGKTLGRPAGRSDTQRRRRSGYFARWANVRER